ncbi:MAG TPA: AMP-binding protein [Lysobacter sp.]|nr:AMP-binding protein [Lysobacter sp.]
MSAVVQSAGQPHRHAALVVGAPARLFAFDHAGTVDVARFTREVRAVASLLPAGGFAVNLCEDRYRFTVALCAAALRGQTTLLPPSRAPAVVAEVLAQHRGSYALVDVLASDDETYGAEATGNSPLYWPLPAVLPQRDGDTLAVPEDLLIAVGYTSGSTGQPKANPKTWASFRASTAQNLAALGDLLDSGRVTPVVATVPPQHMYGLEMSVLLPLLGPLAVHGARPFFPEDIARALGDAPSAPLLVTTPVHLRALVESGMQLPPLRGIVSATAPLSRELALAAEQRFGCEVREVFGSTETCVIARRRTAHEVEWTPLPGVHLASQPDGTAVHAPHLAQPVVLADLVEVRADGRFALRGRNADLLEIAGKRASLGDLTRRLLAVPGVRDGVVFQLDPCERNGVARIAALAVAPGLDAADVLASLREHVDPVFLPRPLRLVAALPRNETGKLPHDALAWLLRNPDTASTD